MSDPTILVGLLALGLAVGVLAGLLGIGGGMIMVPFLVALFARLGVSAEHVLHMAIATSLSTILFTSLSSVRAHHRRGGVLWPVVLRLAPGLLAGAMLGAQIAAALPTRPLAAVFAAFIAFSAVQLLRNRKPKASRQLPGAAGLFAVGSGIGAASSILGAGGAFMSVPFMVWCNVRIQNAVGTAAALGFPIASAGAIGYVIAGRNIDAGVSGAIGFLHLPAMVTIALASIMTAPLGARLAHSLDIKPLKRMFSVLLFLLAAYMAHKALTGVR